MRLDYHNGLAGAKSEQATRLIVRDVYDQPLLILIEDVPGKVLVYKATDREFASLLAAMGHTQPARVTSLSLPDTRPGDFQIE